MLSWPSASGDRGERVPEPSDNCPFLPGAASDVAGRRWLVPVATLRFGRHWNRLAANGHIAMAANNRCHVGKEAPMTKDEAASTPT